LKRRFKVDKKTGDLIPLRVGVMPIRIGDYPYGITDLGRLFLRKLDELNKLEATVRLFNLSTRDLPQIALKRNRFKGHRTRE
jgi:hypothetical protein